MTSKNEIVDSPYQYGLGYLDFTPACERDVHRPHHLSGEDE